MAFRDGNRITLLRNGTEYFPALIEAIGQARHEVHLESYIFADDETGRAVADALKEASQRGVRVNLLLDGYGTRDFPPWQAWRLREAGCDLMFFRPDPAPFRIKRYRLRRMHRKLAVIDARLAFVGGINVIDDLAGHDSAEHRYDYAVRVEGPLLQDIYPAVRRLWWLVRWSRVGHRPARSLPLPIVAVEAGDLRAEFLQRDNFKHRRDIEEAYLAAIHSARDEILIANAYFLPGHRFRQALIGAAARGVRVTLMLQGRTDHKLFQLAERALYRYFLERGVRIFEYHVSELHAKAAVVDGCWATVGSSNIDPFSLLLAREANVVVYDRSFAEELRTSLLRAIEQGTHAIERRAWSHIAWRQRFASWLVYGMVRLTMGLLGLAARE
jgi:cardiolipin synthase